jgi:hypothetical protein
VNSGHRIDSTLLIFLTPFVLLAVILVAVWLLS